MLGLSLEVLGWFWCFALVLVGAFGACWVLRVADTGPLPLLVGMDDPWMSGLLCVGWLWPLVEGLLTSCTLEFLCALVVFLSLAVIRAGGQISGCLVR